MTRSTLQNPYSKPHIPLSTLHTLDTNTFFTVPLCTTKAPPSTTLSREAWKHVFRVEDLWNGCHCSGCHSNGCRGNGCRTGMSQQWMSQQWMSEPWMSLNVIEEQHFFLWKKGGHFEFEFGLEVGRSCNGTGGRSVRARVQFEATLHCTRPYPHSTLHTSHFTFPTPLYTQHSTLQIPHYPLSILRSYLALYTLQSALCTLHSSLHTLHLTLRTSYSTNLYRPHCTLPAPCTPHLALYT